MEKTSNRILRALFELQDKNLIGNRWSSEEIAIVYNCKLDKLALIFLAYQKYGFEVKRTLDELIDEDFTSRAYDNVKAAIQMVRH